MDDKGLKVIAIGGSAGAIAAVSELCSSLSNDPATAVCIVIHVGARGPDAAQTVQNRCPIPFRSAVDGERMNGGCGYVAPPDRHLSYSMEQSGSAMAREKTSPVRR